jgi:ABC-type polysaccharide/polyol phosphate export permease
MEKDMKRFFRDVRKYGAYTRYAAWAELKSEVANSYLNWLWWVLEPFCFMLIYTFIFGVVFNAAEPYFNIFIFIGLAFWDFFNRCTIQCVRVVRNNKGIISKVYVPKFVLIFVRMLVNGFKMMISFLIVFIMMAVYRVPLTWYVLYFPLVILIMMVFTFACCTFLMHFGVFIEDLFNVVTIALKAMFYLTGVFYNIQTRFPSPYNFILLHWNPLANLIADMRYVLLYGKAPYLGSMLIILAASLVLSAVGIRLIYKNENTYVKVV